MVQLRTPLLKLCNNCVMDLFLLKAVNGDSEAGLRHLSDKLCSNLRVMSTIATKEQMVYGQLTYLSTTEMY